MPASRRPYLIRAIYDWCSDNGHTPHILVSADYPGVVIPREYVHEGRITLNVSASAVRNLDLGNDLIWFSARFGGRPMDVQFPPSAVLAVFARENGEGVVFGEVEPLTESSAESDAPQAPGTDPEPPKPPKPGRPNLRLVK